MVILATRDDESLLGLVPRARCANVLLAPELERDIAGGFPQGDDAFDAAVGLFGMIEVLLNRRKSGEPEDEKIRKLEGWIFGQSGAPRI